MLSFPTFLCALFPSLQSDGLVHQEAAYRRGPPMGFAVSSDDTVAWMAEGSNITVFDLTSGDAVVSDSIPVEAMTLAIEPDGTSVERLFVAGGPLGFLKVEGGAGNWSRTVLDEGLSTSCWYAGDRWCTDVGLIRIGEGLYVVAVYGGKGGALGSCNELCLYDLAAARSSTIPIGPVLHVPLSAPVSSSWPVAWSLAVRDTLATDEVYVAMGTAGLVRVSFTDTGGVPQADVSQPFVIDLASLPFGGGLGLDGDPPFPDTEARFLDVVVTGQAIYAAADAAGLVQIPFGAFPPAAGGWSRYSPGAASDDQLGTYAVRVAVASRTGSSARIAVSGNAKTSQLAHGMPFSTFGVMGWDATPGGSASSPNSIRKLALYREQSATTLVEQTADALPGPLPTVIYGLVAHWNGQNQDEIFVYTDEMTRFRVSLSGPESLDFAIGSTGGNVTTDGIALLADPDIMIFGQDGGAEFEGALLFDSSSGAAVSAIPGTLYTDDDSSVAACTAPACGNGEASFPRVHIGGIWSGTQWMDSSDPTAQWMVQGKGATYLECPSGPGPCDWKISTGGCWEVSRFVPDRTDGENWSLHWWQLRSPFDPDHKKGGAYFCAHHDPVSDLVFLLRGNSRYGLLVTSRSILESGWSMGMPVLPDGALLGPEPTYVATHTDDFPVNTTRGKLLTLNARAFTWRRGPSDPGLRVLAVTTGHTGPNSTDPGFGHAKTTFFRIDSLFSAPQDRVLAFGPQDGTSSAISLADVDPTGGSSPRTFAFVADFGGRLLVYDLRNLFSTSTISGPSAQFVLPPSKLDGARENLQDIELVWRNARLYAYLSTWRRGLTILDVTDPMTPVEIGGSPIRLPGWCQGVALRRDPTAIGAPAVDADGVPVTHLIVGDHATSTRVFTW